MHRIVCSALTCIFLSLVAAGTVQAQFSVFGEFNVQAGRLNDTYGDNSTIVGGAGNFGLQFSIIALTIGAGPVYRHADDIRHSRSYLDEISVQFPVGLQLRIPIHKELLVGGAELFGVNAGYGYSAHIGLLFRGPWNDRGFFLNAGFDPQSSQVDYIGAGLKMTLPGL
jgi:hypothetical protein